ncbi:hypothetical protein [Mannheimia haemolytica]|uniref:hypothetical protein n=1 Tax=Mannheimia haemolytica TaxID=75985 RepID=UPI001377114F|nr:hypothetical protein [Mannheimia haemolytica]NBB68601.1 hypothetical protein [Mannheimia haemolytica]
MSNQEFVKLGSVEPSTIDELQKEDIRQAILKSVSITPYHVGLEIAVCQAISAINKFSDGCITEELLDTKKGDKYRKNN